VDRKTQLSAEFKALCTLCDETIARNLRQNLIQSLSPRKFTDPEHRVVFESICALFPRGPITAKNLIVHLNNRGFTDTGVEKYFSTAASQDKSGNGAENK
jgi:DnaB-like helicase N terminal domain